MCGVNLLENKPVSDSELIIVEELPHKSNLFGKKLTNNRSLKQSFGYYRLLKCWPDG